MYAVGALNSNPVLKKKIGGKMTEGMLMPYRAALKKAGGPKKTRKLKIVRRARPESGDGGPSETERKGERT